MPQIHANRVELYYELHGPENAPLLVLNNGILMSAAASWAFQTKTLAVHYRVLQYDCQGQGQSAHPESHYTMDLHAEDLAALLTVLGIEKAHLAGISYGGEVIQAFALQYPERIQSLILADTVSEVGPELRLTVERSKRGSPRQRLARLRRSLMQRSHGIFRLHSSPPTRRCWQTQKSATPCWIMQPSSVCASAF